MSTLTLPSSSAPPTAPLAVDDLRELIETVTRTTGELQRTHVALQGQVRRLQGELAEANAQLRRSKALAALGEVAAGIAHEVRNPLGSIRLYAQMLAEDVGDRPPALDLCDKIGRAVTGLDAIVRDVLLFAGEIHLHAAPEPAREIVDHALAACAALVADDRIAVSVRAPRALRVCVDANLLTSALANVVRNAIEALEDAGTETPRIRIGASRRRIRRPDGGAETCAVFSVADNGPGIPPEVVERMFNPFFTTRPTGTGLGLAMVHRIVEAHEGHVHVASPPSGGAVVELRLPHDTSHADRSCHG
ncbi:MAG: sensor histidine kinase [Planctomycetota bacterium]|jgi:two-component system sensor histidine kinase HydH